MRATICVPMSIALTESSRTLFLGCAGWPCRCLGTSDPSIKTSCLHSGRKAFLPRVVPMQRATPTVGACTDCGYVYCASTLHRNFRLPAFLEVRPAFRLLVMSSLSEIWLCHLRSGVPDNVEVGWANNVGQDFKSQNAHGDFAEFHLWPVNWNTLAPGFATKWIQVSRSLVPQLCTNGHCIAWCSGRYQNVGSQIHLVTHRSVTSTSAMKWASRAFWAR